jgi:membrane-bound metal-dependent hydrolase YbcI (DUF457 family)
VKLWQAFIAVQFVDFVWAGFILTGIEKARIIEGFTQANHLDLYHMPYTHSLLAALLWALFAALGFRALSGKGPWAGPLWIAALVFSHWLLDLIVHVPDLIVTSAEHKAGFGLWNYLWISYPLELIMTLGALAIYIRRTQSASPRAALWAGGFAICLITLQSITTFGPPPASTTELALTALFAFSLLALCAGRFERGRTIKNAG